VPRTKSERYTVDKGKLLRAKPPLRTKMSRRSGPSSKSRAEHATSPCSIKANRPLSARIARSPSRPFRSFTRSGAFSKADVTQARSFRPPSAKSGPCTFSEPFRSDWSHPAHRNYY
jgi:hypothetical protein